MILIWLCSTPPHLCLSWKLLPLLTSLSPTCEKQCIASCYCNWGGFLQRASEKLEAVSCRNGVSKKWWMRVPILCTIEFVFKLQGPDVWLLVPWVCYSFSSLPIIRSALRLSITCMVCCSFIIFDKSRTHRTFAFSFSPFMLAVSNTHRPTDTATLRWGSSLCITLIRRAIMIRNLVLQNTTISGWPKVVFPSQGCITDCISWCRTVRNGSTSFSAAIALLSTWLEGRVRKVSPHKVPVDIPNV